MPEPHDPHVDLAGFLLGTLGRSERDQVERHLEDCEVCLREAGQLASPAELLRLAAPPFEAPPDIAEKAVTAVRREASARPARVASPRRRLTAFGTRRLIPVAAAAAVAVVVVAVVMSRDGDDDREGSLAGPVEIDTVLRSPTGGPAQATVVVVKTGIGRVVDFDSAELPILPTGEYYELWFIGRGDTPKHPNRVSAGTFHPDENGRSDVTFAAAVDPAEYPIVSITREPGDGNPASSGMEVLRSVREGKPRPGPLE